MRSIWSGAVSFGLIYIPVNLFNATTSHELDFDLLRRGDLCRIRYARVCEETGEEVPYEDIVKGYEFREGEYVVIEDEDFKRANVKKTRTIEITSFVRAEEIDQKFLEKPYFLEPEKGAEKAYALLREAMRKSGKVAVARFVLRTREHLAILKPEDETIVLNQMRFPNELREPEDLTLPGKEGVSAKELNMAVKLIDQLTEPWEPEQFHDTYIEDLKRIIQDKVEGREPAPEEEEALPVEVTDLFARLSESLEQARSARVRVGDRENGGDKKGAKRK
jgi:DNA end-binding protein Ku